MAEIYVWRVDRRGRPWRTLRSIFGEKKHGATIRIADAPGRGAPGRSGRRQHPAFQGVGRSFRGDDVTRYYERVGLLPEPERLHYRILYNLACHYSRLGEQKRGKARNKAFTSAWMICGTPSSVIEASSSTRTDESLREVPESKKSDFDLPI